MQGEDYYVRNKSRNKIYTFTIQYIRESYSGEYETVTSLYTLAPGEIEEIGNYKRIPRVKGAIRVKY